jgi:hypothetical protein
MTGNAMTTFYIYRTTAFSLKSVCIIIMETRDNIHHMVGRISPALQTLLSTRYESINFMDMTQYLSGRFCETPKYAESKKFAPQ